MSLTEIDQSEPGIWDHVQQNIEPQQNAAEHTKLIEGYLQSLFDGKSVDEDREAGTVETGDADLLLKKTPESVQPVQPEQPPVQERQKPAPAPENSELIDNMRNLAMESATAALTSYRSEVGSRMLFRITASAVLLVTALLLFEFSQPARFGVYVVGLACWFAALFPCANLPQHLRNLGSDARRSPGTRG